MLYSKATQRASTGEAVQGHNHGSSKRGSLSGGERPGRSDTARLKTGGNPTPYQPRTGPALTTGPVPISRGAWQLSDAPGYRLGRGQLLPLGGEPMVTLTDVLLTAILIVLIFGLLV